jgi:hypothetical protein
MVVVMVVLARAVEAVLAVIQETVVMEHITVIPVPPGQVVVVAGVYKLFVEVVREVEV